ncbi:hypothetical protein G6F54_013796 [Rhizopus delemar]|nr:hypothetical protein G6F54_013796 [Rhizopus delemar]
MLPPSTEPSCRPSSHHGGARQALGVGGAHVVHAADFQHRRPHDPGIGRGIEQAQGDGGQRQVMQYVQRLPPQAAVQADGDHAAHGKPAQLQRKEQEQQQAHPERRQRQQQRGARH